jgi:hypothetical protein
VRKARLPASAVVLYDTLVDRTDWATGHLPDKYQPRSLVELARWAGQAKSVAAGSLDVLERYGWVRRNKPTILRRGLSTTYQPQEGRARPRPERTPASGAERSRRWRARQQSRSCVAHAADLGERDEQLGPNATRELDRKSDQLTVTPPQVSDGAAQWAAVGEVGGSMPRSDYVACPFCDAFCAPGAGPLAHCKDCWRGAMWKLYEAER